MDLSGEKLQIIEWVTRQDKAGSLLKVLSLIGQLDNETVDGARIMGYRKGGAIVRGKELSDSLSEGLTDIQNGNLISLDQIESESEQW
ncbi:MAG: hypothetical protein ACK5W1_03735 [Flavobacteriales bacterium]|jgi:hypothetical protein